MKTYKVTIKETLKTYVEIQATSCEEAEMLAKDGWKNEKYILDSNDFTGVDFRAVQVNRERGCER